MKVKVEANISIGYSNANRNQIIEVDVDNDLTEEDRINQIDDQVQEWANNFIEINWIVL